MIVYTYLVKSNKETADIRKDSYRGEGVTTLIAAMTEGKKIVYDGVTYIVRKTFFENLNGGLNYQVWAYPEDPKI